MHHFVIKYPKREVEVTTDYPITKENSAAYAASLKEHVRFVESGERVVKFKPTFYER